MSSNLTSSAVKAFYRKTRGIPIARKFTVHGDRERMFILYRWGIWPEYPSSGFRGTLNPMRVVVKGIYEHYRGNRYIVEDIATNTETGEMMVVYRALYGDRVLYVQSAKRFTERVEKPEFDYVGPRMRLVDIKESRSR